MPFSPRPPDEAALEILFARLSPAQLAGALRRLDALADTASPAEVIATLARELTPDQYAGALEELELLGSPPPLTAPPAPPPPEWLWPSPPCDLWPRHAA